MKIYTKLVPVFALVSLVGCSNMSPTEQRVVSGAAIGTVAGAAIGGIAGGGSGAGIGALTGAVIGGTAGYVYDRNADDY